VASGLAMIVPPHSSTNDPASAWRRPGHRCRVRPLVVALFAALALLGAAWAGPAGGRSLGPASANAAPQMPATPAGRQLAWVLAALNAGRTPAYAELRAHFSPAFLAVAPPARLVSSLTPFAAQAPLRLTAIVEARAAILVVHVETSRGVGLRISLGVTSDRSHRIDALLFSTLPTRLAGWADVDAALTPLAQGVGLLAVEVDGARPGRVIHAVDPDVPRAVGSAFKIYVLGALASAIARGEARWGERLGIRGAWKALPYGQMSDLPAGRRLTLRRYAEAMISASDNTATDHLIWRLGRRAVEAAFGALGAREPGRNVPLPTTRELTYLKLDAALRRAWEEADTAGRRRILRRIDARQLPSEKVAHWPRPRAIDTLEWFASPSDIARALIGLDALGRRPGLGPVRGILALNPGAELDRRTWPYAASKAGSELGVLSLNWLLERRDGRRFVLSVMLNDHAGPIDKVTAVAVAQGAIALLARA
jgi:beta-lactamase class A